MKKLLIIGANGFLGKNLLRVYNQNSLYKNSYEIYTADLQNSNIPENFSFKKLDITNKEEMYEYIQYIHPEIIILTAAMTDVDKCEIERDLAKKINFEAPKNIAELCAEINSKLIFMSTDFIFDGKKPKTPYNEKDIPNPLSYYALTKFHAELSILYAEIEFLVCRTAVLYGWNDTKLNFITWILEKLRKGEEITIVTNQINSPTYVVNLAEIIFKLIEKNQKGIYHTAGDSILSRYEMARKCAEIFEYDMDLIHPIENLEQTAQRPTNVGLDITKLKKLLGNEKKIYTLTDGLIHMKNNQ
ncbi:MAG: dTDP-4-dehydrorhamnose reductase [Candidatus Lokiarchaeota archaeon]|nr:dTDP-4-dehydrorhamnose reductase [Candidatus Lokiarchaeota archaeon]